jgi:hypothetical protein
MECGQVQLVQYLPGFEMASGDISSLAPDQHSKLEAI